MPGGWSPGKCKPLLGRHRETLRSVAQNLRNPTLTGTKFGPKTIPLLAQIHKKGTLCGTAIVEKWLNGTIVGA